MSGFYYIAANSARGRNAAIAADNGRFLDLPKMSLPRYPSRCAALLLLTSLWSAAAVSHAAEDRRESEVLEASTRYLAALHRRDVEAVVSIWTEDGVYYDAAGVAYNARELARRELSGAALEDPESLISDPASSSIRFVGDEVALQEGEYDVFREAGGATSKARFSALWLRRDDEWRLDYLREMIPVAPAPQVERSELRDLDWLLGKWRGTGGGFEVSMSVERTPDGNYLLQRYSVQRAGQVVLRSEGRIGWDLADQVLRYWAFHSDAGFTSGEWKREGESWVVTGAGVTADGRRTSTLAFWAPEGDERLWFKMHAGSIDDAPVADLIVEFVRRD